jgi:hypothetical protein
MKIAVPSLVVLLFVRVAHADCPVSLDGAYTYADDAGSHVSLGGTGPIHVEGKLGAEGEVYAGVGMAFTDNDAPIDASTFRGISFKAKRGAAGTAYLRVKLPDGNTDPRGKVCEDCFNDFGLSFQAEEDWVRYEVPFDQLKQEGGWGKPNPPAIDKT